MPGFIENSIELKDRSTHPSTPPSGYVYVYRLVGDGSILCKDSSGNVRELTNNALESLVQALSGKTDVISGSYISIPYVASISAFLQSEITSLQTQVNNLDLTYATDAAVAAISAFLQSEIDSINTGTVTSAYVANLSAYLQSEIDSIQSQINNLDNTYATDAAVAATSAYLQSEIDNLDNTYATDAAVASISATLVSYLPSIVASVTLDTTNDEYVVENSRILSTSVVYATLVPPTSASTIYSVAVTNISAGTMTLETSDVPSTSGYKVNYVVYNAAFGVALPLYATWDTSITDGGAFTYTNNNLTINHTGGTEATGRSNIGVSSGKWFVEVTIVTDAGQNTMVGLIRSDFAGAYPGQAGTNSAGYYQNTIFKGVDGSTSAGHTLAPGDKVGIYFDMDTGVMRFYANDTALSVTFNIPGWSAGQTYYIASGADSAVTYAHTANFGPNLSSGGASAANGLGANAGLFVYA